MNFFVVVAAVFIRLMNIQKLKLFNGDFFLCFLFVSLFVHEVLMRIFRYRKANATRQNVNIVSVLLALLLVNEV